MIGVSVPAFGLLILVLSAAAPERDTSLTSVVPMPLSDCVFVAGIGAIDGGGFVRERNDGNILLVSDPALDFLTILSEADLECWIPPLPPPVVEMVPETASNVDVAAWPTAPSAAPAPPTTVIAPSPMLERPDHHISLRRMDCSAFNAATLN